MPRFVIFLPFLVAWPVFAASNVRLQQAVTVYSQPDFESSVAFAVAAGQIIAVGDKNIKGFRKIRAEIDGRKRLGYVPAADLSEQKTVSKRGKWGAGGGGLYTRLSQAAKSFSTTDQVNYTTTEYASSSFSFAGFAQFGEKGFYRLYTALKNVEYQAKATLDVPGSSVQPIEVAYTFGVVGAQIAWRLWTDHLYVGGGIEAARAFSVRAKIGNQDLSSKSEKPAYMGGHGMVGGQYFVSDHFSVFAEFRVGVVANQSPMIGVVEVVSALVYWP